MLGLEIYCAGRDNRLAGSSDGGFDEEGFWLEWLYGWCYHIQMGKMWEQYVLVSSILNVLRLWCLWDIQLLMLRSQLSIRAGDLKRVHESEGFFRM